MNKTVGEPQFTARGREVLAFHLHRYLAHWLAKSGTDRVFVTVGWEHADFGDVTIEVGRNQSSATDVAWGFGQLRDAYRDSGARIELALDGGHLHAVPILEPDGRGTPTLLAFAVVPDSLSGELVTELELHTGEAIRAARRNSVRLLFDEADDTDMKALMYELLDHLPEWSGCDVAAACVLAHSLEAMAFDRAGEADFYVMAERLFCSDDEHATRLVGLAVDTRDDIRTTVDAAIELLADGGARQIVAFTATDDGYLDEDGQRAVSVGVVEDRPHDARSVLVPIVAQRHETELIGFLCLAFSGDRELPMSVEDLLTQLADELGHTLRHSPLYTLSASRLRLVREVRRVCEQAVAGDGTAAVRRDEIVRRVVELVRTSTDVPAFSVGYIVGTPRKLRYTASYGWTDFGAIDLDIDVSGGEHVDSGVSALAARLNRPIVLAGGRREGDHQEFKNFLWVHEDSGRIVDARAPGPRVADQPGWTRLGAYYKPARRDAYATVAHPIAFDEQVFGVLALEVDRDTEWTWWAAYGGRLLWELVGSELAFAFWALDREEHG